jgi:hypothetical protein
MGAPPITRHLPALSLAALMTASLVACQQDSAGSAAAANPYGSSGAQLANGVGPYGQLFTESEVAAAALDGFNLTLLAASPPDLRNSLTVHGVRYLDPKPWKYIRARCAAQWANEAALGQTRSCALTAEDQSLILDAMRSRLAEVENDPGLVGYYVLDDYPFGDVTVTLRAIRALIMESNQRVGVTRPVVCGVGGTLDSRAGNTGLFTADHSYTEEALVNVSPDTCDIVAPYFYGVARVNDPDLVDWSMQDLIPWFIGALHDRGFTQPSLLPIVQAFSAPAAQGAVYIEPTPQNMSAQASAYCGTGYAVALLFFTWSGPDLTNTYANDANLRLGVFAAAKACRSQGLRLAPIPGSG